MGCEGIMSSSECLTKCGVAHLEGRDYKCQQGLGQQRSLIRLARAGLDLMSDESPFRSRSNLLFFEFATNISQ